MIFLGWPSYRRAADLADKWLVQVDRGSTDQHFSSSATLIDFLTDTFQFKASNA